MTTVMYFTPAYRGLIDIRARDQALRELQELNSLGFSLYPWWTDCSSVVKARNLAMAEAFRCDCEFLVMQDSDIYVPRGTAIARMTEIAMGHNATLVGAICGLRRINAAQVVPNVRPFRHGEVYEADRVGTGLVLYDMALMRDVSEQYDGPWFAETYKDKRQTELNYGEDFFNCAVIKQYGGRIVVDGTIPTVHAYTDHMHLHYDPERSEANSEPIAGVEAADGSQKPEK